MLTEEHSKFLCHPRDFISLELGYIFGIMVLVVYMLHAHIHMYVYLSPWILVTFTVVSAQYYVFTNALYTVGPPWSLCTRYFHR